MRRTRKWAFVAKEAKRLAALRLSPLEIANRLGLNKSTVTRWIASGKLANPARRRAAPVGAGRLTPEQWVAEVRETYDLDATDEQLVLVAGEALKLSMDLAVRPQLRMAAAGRFQGIVKQLALVTRTAVSEQPAPVQNPRKTFRVVRRWSGVDPRQALMRDQIF